MIPDRSYQIIRSTRKTVSIQVKPDGQVIVRCPKRMREEDVRRFVASKADWIGKHLAKCPARDVQKLTEQELEQLRDRAKELVTARVRYFAPIVGVTYTRITIRAQHTRWGSCNGKGSLNFNCLLALTPPEVLDYVVVHELCHRKEMNHSPRFWQAVEGVLPDYKARREWLKANGNSLMARL